MGRRFRMVALVIPSAFRALCCNRIDYLYGVRRRSVYIG